MNKLPGLSLLVALLSLTGVAVAQKAPPAAEPAAESPPAASADAPGAAAAAPVPAAVSIDDIRSFVTVFREVQRSYVEPVSSEDLMRAAIRGLLSDLDPHSAFLDAEEMTALQGDTSGEYGGLGLEVQVREGLLTVIAPIDDTPAARAGIRPGDVIISIDGTPIESGEAGNAIDRLRGKPGTEVSLSLAREGEAPFELKLTREIIRVTSARMRELAPGYPVLRIAAFQDDTTADARQAIEKARAKAPLKGLILDLRSNPGGLLDAAVGVSDLFLDEGVIVSTKGRLEASKAEFTAAPGDLLDGAPIVVLIDTGTASAAEIVAGALQDHTRGLVLGTQSFGKGSVQSVLPLREGQALKLTTARYYTPKGRSIQAEGIHPDIELLPAKVAVDEARSGAVTEASLARHLDQEAGTETRERDRAAADLLAQDFVLAEALNVLKAMARWGARTP